ncbi:MAG: DNA-directed RNA polymerase subunit omega [Bacteroidales bacterium]|jgi:DNA-directed RNA polymerase subunit K/omega|nr:DNA-directed RNA polymerase subunit omega [Bacteroidales bacterium]
MDYKRIKTEDTAVTRTMREFSKGTNNVYETVAILAKRADQIEVALKKELDEKVQEFATPNDTLDEVFENREQIEIARFYENLPKPTLLATWEYVNDRIYFRNPIKQDNF